MAWLKLHAGDWGKGQGAYSFGSFALPIPGSHGWKNEAVQGSDLQEVSIATEENVKRAGGAVGWGLVGAATLGPVGLLAGLILGGSGKDVTFIAKFKDGRKILATTDAKTYTKIAALVF